MSTIGEPPPDDELKALAEQIDSIETEKIAADIIDFSALEDGVLLRTFQEILNEMQELHETLHPHTERGKELHSLYTAAKVQLLERDIL